jgi:hypothetical protein
MTGIEDVQTTMSGIEELVHEEEAGPETNIRTMPNRPYCRPPILEDDEHWVESNDMTRLAEAIIQRYNMAAGQYSGRFFWKAKGGKDKGAARLGKCQAVSASSLLHYALSCDYVIWLAVDHLSGKPDHVIEAVLHHELCHVSSDPDSLDMKIVGHDAEVFAADFDRYGLYAPDMVLIKEHAMQARLI